MSEQQIFTKCAWRLIPFMALLYVVNFIDRVNVGFAALTMNRDLGFSPAAYGFGAGVFFLAYILFQMPANWMLERLGARRWMFCILAAWGLISASNAFVQGPMSFYAVRVLLGIAEAGFFPGMLLYLTYWFPQAYLARYSAGFNSAVALAFVIGGPLASIILRLDGALGFHGWQWLFLLEGLPTVLLAFAVLKFLPDGPMRASWLSDAEKDIIKNRLEQEDKVERREFWEPFRDLRIYALAIAFFGHTTVVYGLGLWLPQIVQAMGFSDSASGFVVAMPYLVAAAAMVLWARSSDMRDERVWHIALAWLLGAAGLAGASAAQDYLVVLFALTVTTAAVLAAFGPLHCLVKSILSGPAAGTGIALYIAIGNLGGFVGPYVIGALREETGTYSLSMLALASGLVMSAGIVLGLGRAMAVRTRATQPRVS